MRSEEKASALCWKNIRDENWTSQFISSHSRQRIYLKKIQSKLSSDSGVTVFLFHDITSYHGRFHHLTSWFQNNYPSVSFVMMDFAGHGLSTGTRGHFEDFNHLVEDMSFVFKNMTKGHNDRWIVLGHGMGAMGLLDLINRFDESLKQKVDQLILSNFILNFSSPLFLFEKKIADKFLINSFLINQSRPLSIYHAREMLSSHEDQVNYLKDPLIIKTPTFQSLKALNEKVKTLFQESYFLDKPTLLLSSQSPYLVGGGMESFSKGFKKGILTKKNYSNFQHDLYNERDSQALFNDIAQWIKL